MLQALAILYFTVAPGLQALLYPTNSVKSIGKSAFYDCSGLTSVTIHDSLTSIGDSAFYGCSGLKTVYYCGTEEQWNTISISGGNECLTNANIYFRNNADFNSDGATDKNDFDFLASQLLSGAPSSSCDFNSDGKVSLLDLREFMKMLIQRK